VKLLDAEHWPVHEPSGVDERHGGRSRIADLGVLKPARAKELAPAHDHSSEQGSGVSRQLGEFGDEPQFLRGQQIRISGANRREYCREIVEVVAGFEPGISTWRRDCT